MTKACHGSLKRLALGGISAAAFALGSGMTPAFAADWSTTEIQYQFGNLDNPFAGNQTETSIITLQHASGNRFGDVFFFVDFLDDGRSDFFNDKDAYAEGYAYFSSAKILGSSFGGPVKDVGVLIGFNYDADADFLAYLPGAYIDWNVPGFAFLRTQFTAVIDDSTGIANGGNSPSRDNGFEADVSWAYPIQAFGQYFSFEGHIQYDTGVDNEFGVSLPYSVLGQPQFRWDVGYAVSGKKDQFFIGTEYQFWINKLGTNVDESAFQALGVWRF